MYVISHIINTPFVPQILYIRLASKTYPTKSVYITFKPPNEGTIIPCDSISELIIYSHYHV
jgi:hypothetical protein